MKTIKICNKLLASFFGIIVVNINISDASQPKTLNNKLLVQKNIIAQKQQSTKKEIDVFKLSIGGIKMRMQEKDIIKKLGKPKSRTIRYDNVCHVAYLTTWKYDGLEIGGISSSNDISKSQVDQIKASDSRYSTEKGVKVGDSMDKARKTYSNFKNNLETGKDGDYLSYPNAAFGGLTFIGNKQMIIKEISLLEASC